MIKKRGSVFFTVDTMIGGLILLVTITSLLAFYSAEPETMEPQVMLDNTVVFFTDVTVAEFSNSYSYIYRDFFEPHPDYTLHQKIAYWIETDNVSQAQEVLSRTARVIVPEQVGLEYIYDGQVMYSRPVERQVSSLSHSFLTYYIDESGSVAGPKITRINILI